VVVWNPEGQRLYSYIDRSLWERVNHNPIAFLQKISPEKLEQAVSDQFFWRIMHGA